MLSITTLIIAINCIVSFIGFSNQLLIDEFIFYPPAITNRRQWYRFITCGFIHANFAHLAFNMYSFYMFGDAIEMYFAQIFGGLGKLLYLLMYLTTLIACLLPTYFKNKNNYHYKSLGASGAVSAVVFAFIFLSPLQGIGLVIVPGIYIPAFIFGFLYLGITAYLAKRGNSYINHAAHFWGAVYGIAFLIIACSVFSHFNALTHFTEQVRSYLSR